MPTKSSFAPLRVVSQAILCIGAVLTNLSCSSRDDGEKPPNILLITMDTTRSDHCSVYGYERRTTPFLEELADQGACFYAAYAPMPTTAPSHATMFTSTYPIYHRVIKNGLTLSQNHVTLAEHLSSYGYQTAAIISSFVLNAQFGLDQGFDHYDQEMDAKLTSFRARVWQGFNVPKGFDRRANDTTKKAVEWLQKGRDKTRSFFLFVHYFEPHSPYIPPEPFASQFKTTTSDRTDVLVDRYDGGIAYTDHEIGNLLAVLDDMGLADDTIVLLVGDHGEGLMQHGHPEHGVHLYEEAVRVPLIIRWPNRIPEKTVVREPVELVDLVPTILNLLGLHEGDMIIQGKDLVPVLLGLESIDMDRPIYLHRRHYSGDRSPMNAKGEKFGIRIGDWKYIMGPEENTFKLFNLECDPEEYHNVIGEHPDIAANLSAKLDKWMSTFAMGAATVPTLSDEHRETLEALGYVE